MADQTPDVVGSWEKISMERCGQNYPEQIRFQDNGLYFAENVPEIPPVWDVGTHQKVDSEHIKLSLSNDAILTYQIYLEDDILTFVDAQGCEVKYRRVIGA